MFKRISMAGIVLAGALASPDLAGAVPFDAERATDAYLQAVDAASRARSAAYAEGGYALGLAGVGVYILAALFILVTGTSRGFRSLAESLTGSRAVQVIVCAALFFALLSVLTLPFEYYGGFVHEGEFGRSNQTLEEWLRDHATRAAVSAGLFALFAAIVYDLIRRAPKIWWLFGAGVATLFAAFVVMAAPLVVTPLFNTYEPMEAGPLKEQILTLARGNGIPADEVYRFDASRQDTRLSAHVDVLLGAARISLSDNLLERGTGAEIRNIVGHEIGHRVLNHTFDFLVMFALIAGVVLALVSVMFRGFVRADGGALGLRDEADPASIPILFVLATFMGFLAMPAFNAVLHVQEGKADIFSLDAAREPDGLATAVLKHAQHRKLDPASWEEALFTRHPNAGSRILRAMRWKALRLNELPVPGLEVEVGCSYSDLRTPMAEVRWYSDGTDPADLLVIVAVTKVGFSSGQFVTIVPGVSPGLRPGPGLSDIPRSALDFQLPDLEFEIGRGDELSPLFVALRIKHLEPGGLYFWSVVRREGAISETVRTEVGSCPADIVEE